MNPAAISKSDVSGSRMDRKLVIVPAYDECEAIGAVVAAVQQQAPGYDVLVLDDGSADDTARVAVAAGAKVLRMPFNLGIGGAMQAGYEYALEKDYDVAVQVDGDGQHDLAHLARLEKRLGEAPSVDMVTGSRFLESDSGGFRSSMARRCGIRLFARIVTIITKQKVTDPTSGFRMTNRRAIDLFAYNYPHEYPEIEGILLVHAHGLRSCEVPVLMRERETGKSTISSLHSIYYVFKVLLAIAASLFRARPVDGNPSPTTAAAGREDT